MMVISWASGSGSFTGGEKPLGDDMLGLVRWLGEERRLLAEADPVGEIGRLEAAEYGRLIGSGGLAPPGLAEGFAGFDAEFRMRYT